LFNSLPQQPQLVGQTPSQWQSLATATMIRNGSRRPTTGTRFPERPKVLVIKQRGDARLERRARTCLAPFWHKRRPASLSNMASPISAAGRA
jgi:hypothetical protein